MQRSCIQQMDTSTGVSRRQMDHLYWTVVQQRYIAQLGEMGIPIYAERGPYGGYSLVRG